MYAEARMARARQAIFDNHMVHLQEELRSDLVGLIAIHDNLMNLQKEIDELNEKIYTGQNQLSKGTEPSEIQRLQERGTSCCNCISHFNLCISAPEGQM